MATTATTDDWTAAPYAPWLEECIQELVKADPCAIAMSLIDKDGLVSTCYYNTSPNDRACMIDAMRDDARWEWLYANKEEVRAILEDEDDDELQDTDTESDSEE